MREPWLSVVMPVYNGSNYLESALRSVLDQGDEVGRIEVIAVDGGSSDLTPEILERYGTRLPLEVHHRPDLDNWVAKTNFGLERARARYVCFLHHDDRWLPLRLRTLRSLVATHPDVTLFLHPSRFIDPDGRRAGIWRCPLPEGVELPPRVMMERLLVQNFIAIPAPVFARGALQHVGGLDESLWYAADWDFWLKLASTGKSLYHSAELTDFRIHPQAQTIQRSVDQRDLRAQLETVLARHLDACPLFSPGKALRRVARFSVEVNSSLAAAIHHQGGSAAHLLRGFLSLGPSGWHRYLRDSRIVERAVSRCRIGLARHRDTAARVHAA
jgi:hypothetical protein